MSVFGKPGKSLEVWSGMSGIYFEACNSDSGLVTVCLEDDQALELFKKLSELLAARRAKGFVVGE